MSNRGWIKLCSRFLKIYRIDRFSRRNSTKLASRMT
jgi:hypothetical protein